MIGCLPTQALAFLAVFVYATSISLCDPWSWLLTVCCQNWLASTRETDNLLVDFWLCGPFHYRFIESTEQTDGQTDRQSWRDAIHNVAFYEIDVHIMVSHSAVHNVYKGNWNQRGYTCHYNHGLFVVVVTVCYGQLQTRVTKTVLLKITETKLKQINSERR